MNLTRENGDPLECSSKQTTLYIYITYICIYCYYIYIYKGRYGRGGSIYIYVYYVYIYIYIYLCVYRYVYMKIYVCMWILWSFSTLSSPTCFQRLEGPASEHTNGFLDAFARQHAWRTCWRTDEGYEGVVFVGVVVYRCVF